MKRTHVAVLRGGPSEEHAVSLKTGSSVLRSLNETDYLARDIVITKNGEWLIAGKVYSPEKALAAVDVVFNALHGAYGEDGQIQRLLERLGIRYTGSGSYASAIAMNKVMTKEHLRDSGILMPPHFRLSRSGGQDIYRSVQVIGDLFGPIYVIKPLTGGSSIGTRIARGIGELTIAIKDAFENYEDVMVEKYIAGKEATVGVVENFRGEPIYALPVVEIAASPQSEFFDYDSKYGDISSEIEICPGRFSLNEKDALMAASRLIHQSLGLRHYSRSDFIVGDDGVYFLEVNTLPGLTPTSLLPKAVTAVGSNYRDFVRHVIDQALA